MNISGGLSASLAQRVLERMGSTGQPPERGALEVNVGTGPLLDVLRDEYLRRIKTSAGNSTFKLIKATFGGGKTQFLHCLRELAWSEGFVTAMVGLSPKECPFDKPVSIYQEVARRLELPPTDLEEESAPGLDHVLRQIGERQLDANGRVAFRSWLDSEFAQRPVESRGVARAVRGFLEAVATGNRDDEELLGDYLRGDAIPAEELGRFRLRETLDQQNAFRWLRSLAQVLAALDQPGLVLMFDEMDRNMSLTASRRRAMGDNLRQMIDYCGQSLLPGVVWCYAVPPEFLTTIVPEYPALAQRLKGAIPFSGTSPLQPIIDLERLPMDAVTLLEALGERLARLARQAYPAEPIDEATLRSNLQMLARELGSRELESGTRRLFVKAAVSLIELQRRSAGSALSADELRRIVSGASASESPPTMPGEREF